MTSNTTIRVVEQDPSEAVCCPYCGFVARPGRGEDAEGWIFDPETCVCEHTLFVATDYGFSYRSSDFNRLAGLPDDQKSEPRVPEIAELGYDGFTSCLRIPDAVKIASYDPPPSFFGVYYGFAPR